MLTLALCLVFASGRKTKTGKAEGEQRKGGGFGDCGDEINSQIEPNEVPHFPGSIELQHNRVILCQCHIREVK